MKFYSRKVSFLINPFKSLVPEIDFARVMFHHKFSQRFFPWIKDLVQRVVVSKTLFVLEEKYCHICLVSSIGDWSNSLRNIESSFCFLDGVGIESFGEWEFLSNFVYRGSQIGQQFRIVNF